MERWVEVCGRVSRAKCKRDKGDVLLQEAADPGGSCTLRGVVGNMASCKKKGACHSGLPLTPVDLDQQPYDEKWIQGNLAEQVNSMRLARAWERLPSAVKFLGRTCGPRATCRLCNPRIATPRGVLERRGKFKGRDAFLKISSRTVVSCHRTTRNLAGSLCYSNLFTFTSRDAPSSRRFDVRFGLVCIQM